MVRKVRKKGKLNSKGTSKKPKNTKNAENTRSSEANSSVSSELNFTLPEGNHLDSFDIFRSNEEQ